MRTLVRVALPVAVDQEFTYRVPPSLDLAVEPGMRVLVPFGPRRITGIALRNLDVKPPAIVGAASIVTLPLRTRRIEAATAPDDAVACRCPARPAGDQRGHLRDRITPGGFGAATRACTCGDAARRLTATSPIPGAGKDAARRAAGHSATCAQLIHLASAAACRAATARGAQSLLLDLHPHDELASWAGTSSGEKPVRFAQAVIGAARVALLCSPRAPAVITPSVRSALILV
jgi:hypothetical protein